MDFIIYVINYVQVVKYIRSQDVCLTEEGEGEGATPNFDKFLLG